MVTCGDGSAGGDQYSVHDLGPPRPAKLGYLRLIPAARTTIRRLRPDLVHAHYATSYGLLALASGVRPLVVTAHGSDVLLGRRNPAYRTVLRRVLGSAALVTVPSDEMRDAVHELAGRDLRVATLQYGIDVARLGRLADDTRRIRENGPLELVVARPLRRLYRHDVLLDGLAGAGALQGAWRCTFFGAGEARGELEAQAARLGLAGHVRFVGQRPIAEVERALAAADLYASFSESDGASLALLEAMALGAVPIVSDIPANRAWIRDGENGVLAAIDAAAVGSGLERALRLDRESVARVNRELVTARADRERNLGALERRLLELIS